MIKHYSVITDIINEHKLFDAHQYGFRSEHSTELATLEIIDITITIMDNSETSINIYFYLSRGSLPGLHLFISH